MDYDNDFNNNIFLDEAHFDDNDNDEDIDYNNKNFPVRE